MGLLTRGAPKEKHKVRRLIAAAMLLTAAVAFVSGFAFEAGKATARYTAYTARHIMLAIQRRAPDDLPDLSEADYSDAIVYFRRDEAFRAEMRAKANLDPEIAAGSAAINRDH